MTKKEFITKSETETENIGRQLALSLLNHNKAFIAMRGEMGVGKTAFARGFASALGIYNIKSPTYTIVNEHTSGYKTVFHFDMYRIEDSNDLYSIGYYDYLERDGYIICEWSENISDEIPTDAITVTFVRLPDDENSRKITIVSEKEILC